MVNVLDLLAEHKSKTAYFASRWAADDYFVKQKSAIQAIAWTQGFEEIKKYWLRSLEAAYARLKTTKGDDFINAQCCAKEAEDFLNFLTNLTSSPVG